MKYLRSVVGVAVCLAAAGCIGALVRYLLSAQSAGIKLLATAVTVILASGLLLAYTQGLTLRSALRSMREPPPETPL